MLDFLVRASISACALIQSYGIHLFQKKSGVADTGGLACKAGHFAKFVQEAQNRHLESPEARNSGGHLDQVQEVLGHALRQGTR